MVVVVVVGVVVVVVGVVVEGVGVVVEGVAVKQRHRQHWWGNDLLVCLRVGWEERIRFHPVAVRPVGPEEDKC